MKRRHVSLGDATIVIDAPTEPVVLTDLQRTERLAPGDVCEFRYPAVPGWRRGVVVKNGGSSYWRIRDAETGTENGYFYIEHVRAPGTDPWFS